jgi:hypothetical protein
MHVTIRELREFIAQAEAAGAIDETPVKVITRNGQGAVKDFTGTRVYNPSGFPALITN